MKIFIVLPLIALSVSAAFARFGAHGHPSFQFQEGAQAQLDPRINTTSADQCRYEIIVQTTDKADAGTDAVVSLTLVSKDGTTLSIKDLTSWGEMGAGYDYFERGHTDLFGGSGNCLTPEPCKMLLEHDNSGNKPGWCVDYVKVTGFTPNLTEVSHKFKVDQWLAKDEYPNQLYAFRDDYSHQLLEVTAMA
ncbi:unnamed protein product [Urochloa humidicola]